MPPYGSSFWLASLCLLTASHTRLEKSECSGAFCPSAHSARRSGRRRKSGSPSSFTLPSAPKRASHTRFVPSAPDSTTVSTTTRLRQGKTGPQTQRRNSPPPRSYLTGRKRQRSGSTLPVASGWPPLAGKLPNGGGVAGDTAALFGSGIALCASEVQVFPASPEAHQLITRPGVHPLPRFGFRVGNHAGSAIVGP